MEVGIKDLKSHASEYLNRVSNGEVLTVTKHGTPIAEIVPLERRRTAPDPELKDLIESGTIRWRGVKPVLPRPVKMKGTGSTASEIVVEGRR